MWLERRLVFLSVVSLPSEPKKPLRRGDADCDCVCAEEEESRGDVSMLPAVLCSCEPSPLGPPDRRSGVDCGNKKQKNVFVNSVHQLRCERYPVGSGCGGHSCGVERQRHGQQ